MSINLNHQLNSIDAKILITVMDYILINYVYAFCICICIYMCDLMYLNRIFNFISSALPFHRIRPVALPKDEL